VASPELLAQAAELHRSHPVVECHSDVPLDIYRRRRAGEPAPLSRVWLDRFRAGGVKFTFLTVGGDAPAAHDGEGRQNLRALQTIDDVLDEAISDPQLAVVESAEDVDEVVAGNEIGLVLHLEGLKPLQGRPSMVKHFFRLGLRSAQLTWNGPNEAADGVGVAEPGGLTEIGRELVAELDRFGILVDASHLAEPAFWELTEVAAGPIVASHANAHAVCPHPRNLRDDQIRAVAESGGYVGVCFVPALVGAEATLERVLDHVDHLVGLAGADAVAVGPDYVEFAADVVAGDLAASGVDYGPQLAFPPGLERVETLPVFTAGLLGRGYAEADVAKIVGGNALRVLRAVLRPD
jgi:membrane dipeptidase